MKKIKYLSIALMGVVSLLVVMAVVLLVFKNQGTNASHIFSQALSASTSTLAETTVDNSTGWKALAAGLGIGLAALGGTIGMGLAIAKSAESISRQPEAEGKIRSTFMLGLVFIETVVIYALIVGILVIFVL